MSEPSTTWRYCMSRERVDDEDFYTVRELYTGDDGALSWSADPVAPAGESWLDCCNSIAQMTDAMSVNVLDLTLDPPALVHRRELR